MPINLDANLSKTDFQTNTDDINISSVKATHDINNSTGITGTTEANISGKISSSSGIPSLEAPTLPLEEVINTVVKLDTQSAQALGLSAGTSMNIADFNKAILEKLDSKLGNNTNTSSGIDISKMDGDTLDLFCMLLCQESKEKMIKTFKDLLNTKIKERSDKQQDYAKEVADVTKKNMEAIKKAKEAEKKAKKWGIFKAILGAVIAVITTVVAVAVTAVSMGSLGPVALGFACAGISLAIASAAATCVSSGLTVAALCTDDPEKKAALNKWAMGVGIAAAVMGVGAAICSGGSSIGTSINTITKILNTGASLVSGISQISTGVIDIVQGAENIKLADLQKDLADMKIDLTKLDETIALLTKLIESLTNNIETFVEDLLKNEEKAAKELINVSDAQSNLANEMPC